MTTKRFTMILAAALMLLAVVMTAVACDSGNPETPTTEQSTEAPTQGSEKPAESETVEENTDDGKVTYTVKVVDASGAPVEGVAVQFCDDNGCRMPVATNAEGIVTLTDAESNFHVTLASVPAGFAADATEYYFDGELSLTITLQAE